MLDGGIFMAKIDMLRAREVLDSRGNPTVEAEVKTGKGSFRAMVPSGASTGKHEALELRDGKKSRYMGKGVRKAVGNVNGMISKIVTGMECTDQRGIDGAMKEADGTENKGKFGANAILAVSMACARAGAAHSDLMLFKYLSRLSGRKGNLLPVPQMNIINGGRHAGSENDTQEHMIMPMGAKSFGEALRMCSEIYHTLRSMLKKRNGARGTLIADEGGFAPPVESVKERLELITKAMEKSGHEKDVAIALDSAASEFFSKGTYTIMDRKMSSGEFIDFYGDLAGTFPIVSIEDGMAEDDWEGWKELNAKLGKKMQIVGDDLLASNPQRISRAVKENAANSLLLKLNQIGTVTEAMESAKMAFSAGWTVVVSHRSGETEDPFISDLAVGLSAGQSKFGAPARSDRNSKYNQLIRIEESLGKKARYPGKGYRKIPG